MAADHVAFLQSVYSALGTEPASQTLAASNFHIGTAATTASEHVIYDATAGRVYYDADGVGGVAQQLVTTIAIGLALTNQHFLVV